MQLLQIDSSALGDYSASRQHTGAIVAALKQQSPIIERRYRDLAAQPLAHWKPAVTNRQSAEGELGNALVEAFRAADTVVIGAPMDNVGISSQLKAWIDRIAVAGNTFRCTAAGAEGLATGKRALIGSSRGDQYVEGPSATHDHQASYPRVVPGFPGITDITVIRAEGLALAEAQQAASVSAASASTRSLILALPRSARAER